jgi:hypothetical protein
MAQTSLSSVAPKRKSNPATSSTSTTKPATSKDAVVMSQRAESIDGMFKMVSMVCVMRGQYADAGAINEHSPNIAREVASIANTNEQVAKLIDSFGSVGPYSGLLMAVLPLALQLAANHGRIDAEKVAALDVKSPAQLEEKFKADQIAAATRFQLEVAAAKQEATDAQAALAANEAA